MELDLISNRPSSTDEGLDVIAMKFKSNLSADDTISDGSLPDRYDPHPVFAGMFLMDRVASEQGSRATELDLIYHGSINGDLPAAVEKQGFTLQTAIATDGEMQLEVLYRAPCTEWSWIAGSYDLASPYNTFTGPDPTPTIRARRINGKVPVDWEVNQIRAAAAFAGADPAQLAAVEAYLDANAALIDAIKARFLMLFDYAFTVDTQVTAFSAVPLVPGEYWQCQAQISRVYVDSATV